MKFKPKPMAYVFVFGIIFWICIFKFGFFATLIPLIIVTSIIGIYLRLSGRA